MLLVLAVAAFSLSCGDDSVTPTGGGGNTYARKDLSHKSDVLNNIEFAYNKRNMDAYNELLDDNFTFFYTPSGAGTPIQWGRPDEVTTTAGLIAAADKMDLTIDWKNGLTWLEQISGTETWYSTTVFYHFTIKIGDTTYIPDNGAKAQFTVRNAGTADNPRWTLIEFRDLGASGLHAMLVSSTEPTSWGSVKALYR